MKNKLIAVLAASAALVASASAQLTTTEATGAIADGITHGTVVIAAGFGIGALFLVARVIRKGMNFGK